MDLILQGIGGAIAKLVALDPDVIDAAVASLVVSGVATWLAVITGIPLGALIGISREFPDVDLLGALTPEGQALVTSAAEMTADQLFMSFPFLHWGHYLNVPGLEIPGLRAAFEANRFGQATPTTALYLYHGVHEQNLPIADADKFVETYRRAGANVTYRRLRFGEHIIVALTGVPGALRFLSERFRAT